MFNRRDIIWKLSKMPFYIFRIHVGIGTIKCVYIIILYRLYYNILVYVITIIGDCNDDIIIPIQR